MPGPSWKLTLASASVDKGNKPRLTRTYSVVEGTTEQDTLQPAIHTFAPGAESLEFRAATNRDIVVVFRLMLQSLISNQPSTDLDPNWTTFTATLIVYGSIGKAQPSNAPQHTIADPRAMTKRGRDQAGSRGKASTQGQNTDRQLSLEATARLHAACDLLLARDAAASSGHPFLPYAEQSTSATATVLRVVAMASQSSDTLVLKPLKK